MPIGPITGDQPQLTLEDAYAIQSINVEARVLETGVDHRLFLYQGARMQVDLYDVDFFLEVTGPDAIVVLERWSEPSATGVEPTGIAVLEDLDAKQIPRSRDGFSDLQAASDGT